MACESALLSHIRPKFLKFNDHIQKLKTQDDLKEFENHNYDDVLEYLNFDFADPLNKCETALFIAAENHWDDAMRVLIESDVRDEYAFKYAIALGDYELIKYLLEKGICHEKGLCTAVSCLKTDGSYIEMIKFLLAEGIKSSRALDIAAGKGLVNATKLLLDAGIRSKTALFHAVTSGNIETVDILLEYKQGDVAIIIGFNAAKNKEKSDIVNLIEPHYDMIMNE